VNLVANVIGGTGLASAWASIGAVAEVDGVVQGINVACIVNIPCWPTTIVAAF